jgi:hypothetical protein
MKSRLLSGKVKKLTGTRLDGTRYEYLALGQAEPDLGAPTNDGSILISLTTGTRIWSNALVINTLTSAVGISGDLDVGGIIRANTLSITTTSYIANAQILTTATVNDFVTVIPNQIYENTSSVRVIDNIDSGVEPQILITVAQTDTVAYYSTLTEFLERPVVIQGRGQSSFVSIPDNALQVYGGIGAQQLYISGTAYLGGAEILTTQTGVSSELGSIIASLAQILTTTTNSTSTQTGALIVKGGVGIGKDVYIGGTLVFPNGGRVVTNQIEVKSTGTNTATNTGVLLINGGIVTVTTTTASTSSTTGALTVVGGVGIGSDLNVGGTATFGSIGGIVNVVSTAVSTSSTTGALRVAGGVGIEGNLNVAGTITANQLTIQYTTITTTIVETDDIIRTFNATNSTSTDTGALTVAGGVGVGADMYVGGIIYSQTAEVLTTASVNQYANQTTITAGTDTEVSTSTGNIVIWNTSTLQSVTDRGNTTTNSIRILDTSSQALYVEGGVYIGGDLELKGSLVITTSSINAYVASTIINAGTDTVVSTDAGTGTNTFYIWNTSTLQSVSDRGNSTTNAIKILNTSDSVTTGTGALVVDGGLYVAKDARIDGSLYLKGSIVLTSATLNSYVLSTIINAGTDTAVTSVITSGSNTFYIWNTSTFQTVTDRGNSTTNAIRILDASSSALTVAGGVLFGSTLNVASTLTFNPVPWNYVATTFTSIQVTYGETYLTFTVQPDNTITDISVAAGAGGYGPGSAGLTIPGTTFPGGTSPANDIIFDVETFESPGPVYSTTVNSLVTYVSGTLPRRYDNIASTGTIGIGAGDKHWAFDTDGNLTLPSRTKLVSGYPGAGYIADTAALTGAQVYLASTDGNSWIGVENGTPTIGNGLETIWTFGSDGKLTNPGKIVVQSTASSTSTTSGALTVAGGAGFTGDVYANAFFATTSSYIDNAKIITTATLADNLRTITYLADYITLDPTLVAVSGTSTVYGNYQSGDLASISTYGDYNSGGYYEVWDASGAPGYVVYVGFENIPEFNRIALNINYTQNSGHTVEIDLYNYETSSWDAFGQYTGLAGYFTFALSVISSVPYISSGTVSLRLYHISPGNSSLPHKTKIDYIALEKSIQGGQGPRGFIGYTGSQGLTTSTTSTFTFLNTTNSTSTDTGAVVVKGGMGIVKDVFIGGDLHVVSTSNATAVNNGAVSILGGIGIVKDLWVGGIIYSGGQAVVTTGTVDQALNQTLQSITDKGFTTTNRINITNDTASTSTDTGALTVAGGVGIGGDLWVQGRVYSDNSPTITQGNISAFAATQIVGGTDTSVSSSTGVVTIWNTSTLQSVTDRGNTTSNAISIFNTQSSTATISGNALSVYGGVGIDGSLLVRGKAVFRDDVLFIGSSTSIFSTNTFYTDNILELHTPPGGISADWNFSDGKDIGFRFHYYYNGTDTNAALVLNPSSGFLEWYKSGAESNDGVFTTATFGTFKTGELIVASTITAFSTDSGALRVVGGVGIGGDLYVGGNIFGVSTGSTFSGIASTARNLQGGYAGQIPFQTAENLTTFSNYLLWASTGSVLSIGTIGGSTGSLYVANDVIIGQYLDVPVISGPLGTVVVLPDSNKETQYAVFEADNTNKVIIRAGTESSTTATLVLGNRLKNISIFNSTTASVQINAAGVYNTVTSTSSYTWSFNNDGSTRFPNYSFPAEDGPYGFALVTNGTGTITWSPVLSYVGSVGFTGSSSGFTGSTGYWGSTGELGYSGSMGYTGSQGDFGYTGSTSGFIGSTGYAGSVGYTGSSGAGYTGSTSGYVGSVGYTGSQGFGYTGSLGNSGFVGSLGYSGSQGPRGTDGTSVRILGSVSTYTSLPGYPSSYSGSVGDGYITADTGHLWVWNGTAWIDAGNITGPQGNLGFSGSSGAGFTGSVGQLGYTGSLGYQGSKGALDPWIKVVANYTANNNQRIIADTSAGQFTIALPDSPVVGSYLIITDGGSWKDTPLLVTAGATYTIEGYGDTLVVDITGITVEFIWSGSTWQVTATLGVRGAFGYTGSYGGFAAIGYTGSQANLLALDSNIIPATASTYALGAVNQGWTSVYSNFGYIGSNLYVGSETVDSLTVGKTLVVNTNTFYLGGNTVSVNQQGAFSVNNASVGISAQQARAIAVAMSVVMGM